MTNNENLRRAVRFERPDHIPMIFHINASCWNHYPHDALQALMVEHPLLFPGYEAKAKVEPSFSPVQLKDRPYRDPLGCVWTTSEDGITGSVHEHPLADWSSFDSYAPPDPDTTDGLTAIDSDKQVEDIRAAVARGDELVMTGLRHGHTCLQ